MDGWQERGRIELSSVTQVALSPRYAEDRTLVVVTPAGLAIGRDGGASWTTPARGIVGPFVRDLVWTAGQGAAGVLVASTPSGLYRSVDSGATWDRSPFARATGPLLPLDGGEVLLVSETDGSIWRGRPDDPAPPSLGRLPGAAISLAAETSGAAVWAATTAGVFRSPDRGATWDRLWQEAGQQGQSVASIGQDGIAIGTLTDGLRQWRGGAAWDAPPALREYDVAAIVADRAGRLVAAGGAAGLFVSRDGGQTWTGPGISHAVLNLAATSDGASLWAGLVGGGCAVSGDWGETWRRVPVPDGAVVVDVRGTTDRLAARTVDGFGAASLDGGATWQATPLPDHVHLRAVALPPEVGPALLATDAGLLTEHDGAIRPLHDAEFAHLAVCPFGSHIVVAATAQAVVRSDDGGHTWAALDLPLTDSEEVVDLAFGDGLDGSAGHLIAAATLTAGGQGVVWLRHGAADWRRAIVHPEPVQTVRLASAPGPRGLFAAMGDSVYRPSRLGATLFGREVVDAARSARVIQLAAARGGDEIVLAVLSTVGLYHSRDGGMSWRALPAPDGPPLTALLPRRTGAGNEVMAVCLGGQVVALGLP